MAINGAEGAVAGVVQVVELVVEAFGAGVEGIVVAIVDVAAEKVVVIEFVVVTAVSFDVVFVAVANVVVALKNLKKVFFLPVPGHKGELQGRGAVELLLTPV